MRVIVLGSGILGLTSAYFLRSTGHEVTVLDKETTPASRAAGKDHSGFFIRECADNCERIGVRFRMSHTVTSLREFERRIDHVEAIDERGTHHQLFADTFVVALGRYSRTLLAPHGIRIAGESFMGPTRLANLLLNTASFHLKDHHEEQHTLSP